MTITIQSFNIEFYEDVFALWRKSEGVGLSDADSRENIRSYLERNPGLSFVAFNGSRIVGTVLAGHDGRRGYIHHLAVHPEWRRQGIGRRLVDRCLQTLREAGIQKCHLFYLTITAGMVFWKTLGWEHRPDLFVMSKTLEGKVGESFSTTPSTTAPDQARKMKECRLVAADAQRVAGWAALNQVSSRRVYAGVAEVSVYISARERSRGIGRRLLQDLVSESGRRRDLDPSGRHLPGEWPEHRSPPEMRISNDRSARETWADEQGRWRDVLLLERRSPLC